MADMDQKRVIKVLDRIAEDQRKDAEQFEGSPFTGKVVGSYFGNQGAAIAALAQIVKTMLEGGYDE